MILIFICIDTLRFDLEFLRNHKAHPVLLQLFETGNKGDTSDYQHRPANLTNFQTDFSLALQEEL